MAVLKSKELSSLQNKLNNLRRSPLYSNRIANGAHPVFGEGNEDASILLVGEAPGKNEANSGKPFCGASGKVLDELLNSLKLKRTDIYITNIVKDRPPENRDPTTEEIKIYGPFLDSQIEIIQPKVIGALGKYSSEYLMQKFGFIDHIESIGILHGKVFQTALSYGTVSIVPLYHPAASIYRRALRDTLISDFKILKKLA